MKVTKKKLFTGIIAIVVLLTSVIIFGRYLFESEKKQFFDNINSELDSNVSMLTVENVDSTIKFYEKYFNFSLYKKFPLKGSATLAVMESKKCYVMFRDKNIFEEVKPHYVVGYISPSFSLYVDVDDVGKIYDKTKAELEIVQELEEMFYGRKEFSVKDLNGYIITFSETSESGQR